ncbi:unnamed protein product [Fraxinus pennsylvanica]|uniref:LIM zinc-binding domain-containing protein n=1 Tax=Fraxinus pennsylvanica TaxID=56036 RepID=A0AAD2DY64_9LAMI|nr:unnamed protein product [Fraxinus pennsylvanica]
MNLFNKSEIQRLLIYWDLKEFRYLDLERVSLAGTCCLYCYLQLPIIQWSTVNCAGISSLTRCFNSCFFLVLYYAMEHSELCSELELVDLTLRCITWDFKGCDCKTVYLVDRLVADNRVYHKACFRCHHCNNTLKLSNFNSFEGVVYCMLHFDQLFKRTGSLEKSFEGTPKILKPEKLIENENANKKQCKCHHISASEFSGAASSAAMEVVP